MGKLCWCEDRNCYEFKDHGLEIESHPQVPFHTVMLRPEDCEPDSVLRNFADVLRLVPCKDVLQAHPHQPCAPDGREFQPHVTVLYGLEIASDMTPIAEFLKDHPPIDIEIGEISAFRVPEKPYDVLKIAIHSPQMEVLHNWLRTNFQNKCQFPFSAHITLAYIEKGTCLDLEGPCWWTGTRYTGTSLTFSDKDLGLTEMPLAPAKEGEEEGAA